jgi:4-hydroxybenzoate polyprenyltransferase
MFRDYVRIARADHWLKNVFVLPGAVFAWWACPPSNSLVALGWVALSLLSVCLVCSSNYTINEILDARYDREHPEKKLRPAAMGRIRPAVGYAQWLVLAAAGMGLGMLVNVPFLVVALTLWIAGIAYNVRPVRLKDRPLMDVLSESVNNPLRLLLGWYAVCSTTFPPASLLLSYWMLGAFFMAIKRFAELRHIGRDGVAAAYRKSFAYYTEERLLIGIMFYATACAMLGGVFLIRYKVELMLSVPFLAGFMAYYLHLGFLPNSPAQYPERLPRQRFFFLYGILTVVVVIVCLFIRLPWLDRLFEPTIPTGL